MQTDSKDPNAHNGGVNAMKPAEQQQAAEQAQPRVFIETYGCQMNLADSELMGGILKGKGYTAADDMESADVILINTCAVREKAEERVFGRLSQLLQLKRDNPDLVLGVTGCMAEHLKEKIVDRAPYVDLVVGPDAYRRLPSLVEQQLDAGMGAAGIDVKLDKEETYEGLMPSREAGMSGWITVQRGCDKFCTFCIVPFVRGRERGVAPQEILAQARHLAELGYKEVTLLGQTVNSYKHEDSDFADLLEMVVKVDGLERVRFTSPYPIDFTPKLIETMARHEKICKYLHLPVQSGSERILKKMRRGYTRVEYEQLVTDIRAAMPDVAISTDIIVGFPSETEEEFEMTRELIESTRYDFAYLFKYSERSNTYAARKLEDDIPEKVKRRRLREVIDLQESISAEIFKSRIGGTYKVMIEGPSKKDPNEWCGRTDDFKTAVFPYREGLFKGEISRVTVTDCTSHTLLGQLV
ncbi:MAG: tRNA (N6-isopentenyl adenosine(37)-C2)-methylthiotransferase MiaB [Myxococcota bacterium]|jgi:tRNA-2-methylthio-N6-dimethylallyladenosine synthase|nr:tRNA (N6-isopentenyl adenosine(37)-C2)-methylthiotransferase MiaB [Myxococcota bacterium]